MGECSMIEITMKKYEHDLLTFCADLVGRELTKAALIEWKQPLIGIYTPASVNSMLGGGEWLG